MKNLYKLLLFAIFLLSMVSNIHAQTVNNGDNLIYDVDNADLLTVKNGGKITYNCNINVRQIDIDKGGIMVVNGDLTIETLGFYAAKLVLNGTLIVTGNLSIQSLGDVDNDIKNNGVLVVGGSYYTDTWRGDVEESNKGDVYLSDPTDGDGFGGNGDLGGIDDLLNADPCPIPDDLLDDFIDNCDGENLPETYWEGDVNNDWDNINNWTSSVPDKASNVIIKENASNWSSFCAGKVYYIWNLTLQDNAILTIPLGSRVTVLGNIIIPASSQLIIQNTNKEPTSFIHYGDIDGDITIQWTYDALRFWYIGHATSQLQLSAFGTLSGGGKDVVVYDYNDGWTSLDDQLVTEPLKGYHIYFKDTKPVSYAGSLNKGDHQRTLIDGWQLIANPYSSYYQLSIDDTPESDFINTTGTVYMRTGDTPETRYFVTFNTVSGFTVPQDYNGIIAPCQSFWVKKDQNGEIFIKNDKRLHDVDKSLLKSGSIEESNVLRIRLNNNEDETVIAFRDNATTTFSRKDSEKRFDGDDQSYIYSLKDNIKTIINVLPLIEDEASISLGINTLSGTHILNMSGISQLDTDMDILLEDKVTGEFVNMRSVNTYSFTVDSEFVEDRFTLYFKTNDISTDIPGISETDNINVYIQGHSNLHINCNWIEKEKNVTIYSTMGQELKRDVFEGNIFKQQLSLPTGIYIIKVESENNSFVQKIYIR